VIHLLFHSNLLAQNKNELDNQTRAVYTLIENYSLAREKKDTALLKTILTNDIDQLVSTGEWRYGLGEAVQGMQRSSQNNPGSRTLTVEKIRFLDSKNVIADARYEIKKCRRQYQKNVEHLHCGSTDGNLENCCHPEYATLGAAMNSQ
jgi:hypothetical protein